MSSATAIQYTVEELAAMREAAALAAERSRLRVLHEELATLAADAEAFTATYAVQVRVPLRVRADSGPSDAVRQAAERLERELDEARSALDAARRRLRRDRLRERLAQVAPSAAAEPAAIATEDPSRRRATAAAPRASEAATAGAAPRLAERVEACLAALDDGVELTEDFVALARTLTAIDSARAGDVMAFRALQDEVGLLNRRARAHRAALAAIRELDVRLGALPDDLGPRIAGVRVTLDEARRAADRGAAPDLALLADMVARAEAECRREVERRHVERTVTGILSTLGYDVVEGFEKVVPRGGHLVRKAGWDYHGVRVGIEDGEITLDVVRTAPEHAATPDAVRDEEAEVAFCDDVPTLLESLAKAGVASTKIHRIPPGVVSVPRLDVGVEGHVPGATATRRRSGRERAL